MTTITGRSQTGACAAASRGEVGQKKKCTEFTSDDSKVGLLAFSVLWIFRGTCMYAVAVHEASARVLLQAYT